MPSRRRLIQLAIATLTGCMYLYLVTRCAINGELSLFTPAYLLLAMYLADLGSGIAHFIVDYTPNVQGVGLKELYEFKGKKGGRKYKQLRAHAMSKLNAFQEVVFDFKVHHLSPETLGRRSLLTMTLPAIVFATFPMTVALLVVSHTGWLSGNQLVFMMVLVASATVAQYAHACSHKSPIPLAARVLQRIHIFQPVSAHEIHHKNPDRQFCLLNGWANPVVDRIFRLMLRLKVFRPDGLKVV